MLNPLNQEYFLTDDKLKLKIILSIYNNLEIYPEHVIEWLHNRNKKYDCAHIYYEDAITC